MSVTLTPALLTILNLHAAGWTARQLVLASQLPCTAEGCEVRHVGTGGRFRLEAEGVTGVCEGCAGKMEPK